MVRRDQYQGLFGEAGAVLADADWIAYGNSCLPPNLSALNAQLLDGSRRERCLRVSYEPGPGAYTFIGLSGGSIAEMLDQALTHCGTFVTGHGCPTLTMTVNYLRPSDAAVLVATARVLKVTSVSALLVGDLADKDGRHIASASVVSHLLKDFTRYTPNPPAGVTQAP